MKISIELPTTKLGVKKNFELDIENINKLKNEDIAEIAESCEFELLNELEELVSDWFEQAVEEKIQEKFDFDNIASRIKIGTLNTEIEQSWKKMRKEMIAKKKMLLPQKEENEN